MLPYIALKRFGLCLHQLRPNDLEVVREGRNKPDVRLNHFHQDIIAQEEHQRWYDKISTGRDYYLVVSRGNRTVGLLYLKDITAGMASGHLGMFFWEEKSLNTRTRMLAPLIFADFFFYTAGLQVMDAIVHPKNTLTIDMSRFFGFLPVPDSSPGTVRIVGTQERYMQQQLACMRVAQRLSRGPETWTLEVEGERDPSHQPEILRLIS
jgi:hypothetical protein